MEKFKNYLYDIAKVGGYVCVVSLLISIIIFVLSFLLTGFNVLSALNLLRSILLVASGIGLLVVSGIFISKKDLVPLDNIKKWKVHFKQIRFPTMLIVACTVIVLNAIIVDAILFAIK